MPRPVATASYPSIRPDRRPSKKPTNTNETVLATPTLDRADFVVRPQNPGDLITEISQRDRNSFDSHLRDAKKVEEASGSLLSGIGKFFLDKVKTLRLDVAWKTLWRKIKVAGTQFQNLVQGLVFGMSFKRFKDRVVTDDPGDANFPEYAEVRRAGKEIPERAVAEKAILDKLPQPQRLQYQHLMELTLPTYVSRWALQKMLLDGRLPGKRDLLGEKTLLERLHGLATQDLAAGIPRQKLLSEVVAEVENPVRVNQQAKGTCVVTTAQILLMRRNPSEYVRLIEGLASPAGKVRTRMGSELERADDWADTSDGTRTTSVRLISPPLMDLGEFPLLDYSNKEDKAKLGPIPLMGGIVSEGSARINFSLTGQKFDSKRFFFFNRENLWEKLKNALANGSIPVGLQWEDLGLHQVLIDRIENGRVFFTNPWGQLERMSEEDMRTHIVSAEFPRYPDARGRAGMSMNMRMKSRIRKSIEGSVAQAAMP